MLKVAEKKYTMVYNNSIFDDFDIQIAYDTLDELKKFIDKRGLEFDSYCIIDGFPVKTFASKQWPVK